MTGNQNGFDSRLHRIDKRNREMANGYELFMQEDGLIVARPRRVRNGLSARGVVLFLAGFLVFKGILIASLGEAGYQQRLDGLGNGTTLERASAWALGIDPISRELGGFLNPFFHH